MRQLTTLAILCLGFLLSVKLVAAEQPMKDSIVRIPLLTAHLTHEKLVDRMEIKKINFSPSQQTGLHLHPCPVVGYIAKGSIYFQVEGKKAKILHEGDAFFEPANVKILHFDNLSKRDGSSFIAFYLLGKTDKDLIKLLEKQ
ncbi:MAG: cupin domain-containing protein [Legionella sp.]|nr:cupin domain-containing protein [Legionella sp.]